MKKIRFFAVAVAAIMLALLCVVFAACTSDSDADAKVTITIGETSYEYTADGKETLHDALLKLANEKDFDYSFSGNKLGMWINSIGGIAPNPDAEAFEYIAIYHNINEDKYKDAYVPDKTIDGATYHYSGVGTSGLPLKEGAKYVIVLEAYSG